jgi:hypothetical protein
MTHDRAHADHFYLTHQYLADMLAKKERWRSPRAHPRNKVIRYVRGDIIVLTAAGRGGVMRMLPGRHRGSPTAVA